MAWVKRWTVPASSGGTWIVAQDDKGKWGCSCPPWKYQRIECHHIRSVKSNPACGEEVPAFEYVLAMVDRPTKREDGKLLIPLVVPGNTHQEATICAFLLKQGWPMGEVRKNRRIPREWTGAAIFAYVQQHGEAVFS